MRWAWAESWDGSSACEDERHVSPENVTVVQACCIRAVLSSRHGGYTLPTSPLVVVISLRRGSSDIGKSGMVRNGRVNPPRRAEVTLLHHNQQKQNGNGEASLNSLYLFLTRSFVIRHLHRVAHWMFRILDHSENLYGGHLARTKSFGTNERASDDLSRPLPTGLLPNRKGCRQCFHPFVRVCSFPVVIALRSPESQRLFVGLDSSQPVAHY